MSDLQALGFDDGDRVVVVHVDDLGMCGAANDGGVQALDGAATCGSVMVPCPGFEAMAAIARARPELDLGVHLTLNAEWEGYRWGPVRDDVPGLVSPDGGMWRQPGDTQSQATPDEVERELRAQIDRALAAGIDVTHLDSHMGTVFAPHFVPIYIELAAEYRLPAFLPSVSREALERVGHADSLQHYVDLLDHVGQRGFLVFDHFDANSLHFEPGTGAQHNRARVDAFGPGIAYLITHCAQGGDELAAIAPDWRQRDEERRIYAGGEMAAHLQATGVKTIGMRPLRELLRSRL